MQPLLVVVSDVDSWTRAPDFGPCRMMDSILALAEQVEASPEYEEIGCHLHQQILMDQVPLLGYTPNILYRGVGKNYQYC